MKQIVQEIAFLGRNLYKAGMVPPLNITALTPLKRLIDQLNFTKSIRIGMLQISHHGLLPSCGRNLAGKL